MDCINVENGIGRQMGDETVIRTARSIQSAERSVLEQQADDMLCSNK